MKVRDLRLTLILWLLNYASAQDANCDYYQAVQVGNVYTINSPNWPWNYTGGVQCRWILDCPSGYNCRLDCPTIDLPQTQNCYMDRMLISRSGDPQLNAAETYCGRGSLSNIVSTGQRISIGLITTRGSPGGRFQCQVRAQVSSAGQTCSCGYRRVNRIVGGVETGVNEFPMMAGLADLRISQIKCGGVIISNRYVLTAAHCLFNQQFSNFAVVVGEHNVSVGDSPATKAYRILSVRIHPQFNGSNYDYDIAIVQVAEEIVFSDRVGPACLPFKFANNSFAGSKVTMLGWGTLFPGGPNAQALQKVDVDVISQSTCRSRISSVTDRQMCTFTRGKDACQDDSGGPLLYTDPATGLLFNVGIISYGRFCASDDPGINTRITVLLNWIQTNAPSDYCVK